MSQIILIEGKTDDEWLEEIRANEDIPDTLKFRRQLTVSLDKSSVVLAALMLWMGNRKPAEMMREILASHAGGLLDIEYSSGVEYGKEEFKLRE